MVVSKPHRRHGGLVQYDSGKATASGFKRTGTLNTPPTVLLNAVAIVRAKQIRGQGKLVEHPFKLDSMPGFTREAAGPEFLFEAEHEHAGRAATCGKCSTEPAVDREARRQEIVVHHGNIALGNQVIKDAAMRDQLSKELYEMLCFEMEADGSMNSFPCFAVRDVCATTRTRTGISGGRRMRRAQRQRTRRNVLSVISPEDVAKARTTGETMRAASGWM
jgi:hypothetical protein